MSKKTTCEITLLPNGAVPGVYYSGRRMSGTVSLTFYQQKSVRAVFIRVRGIGQSEWSSQRSGSKSRIYLGKEQYFAHRTTFYETDDDNKLVRIDPGIYSFAFECDLPECLPSSCEEKYGYIRYLATVHIERPDIPDKTFSTAFTVIKPYNLNADPSYQFPRIKQETKNFFRFLVIKPNYLILTATTDAAGYAPGQTIEIQLDVDNKSKINIHEFKIGFYKLVEHSDNSGKKRKKHEKPMAHTLVAGCAAHSFVTYKPEIVVPAVPPTDITTSAILKISYELKIKGKVDRGRGEPKINLPITIGTIPLFSTYRRVHFEDTSSYNYTRAPRYESFKEEESEDVIQPCFYPLYPVFHLQNRRKSQRTSESSADIRV